MELIPDTAWVDKNLRLDRSGTYLENQILKQDHV